MINRWMSPRRINLRDAIQEMFEDPFFGRPFSSRLRSLGDDQWIPVNTFELPEGLMIVAPMPGLQPDDVEISINNNILTLHGRRTPGQEDREYIMKEWDYGPYHRTFELPFPVDMDHVIATLDNGVLTVNLRKSASVMPRRIPVRRHEGHASVTGGETHRSLEGQQTQGGPKSTTATSDDMDQPD